MGGLNKMCVFSAVIKPALGNIIRKGGGMKKDIELLEELKELMACFPNSYINQKLELILIPKTNTYFNIEDCECHLDVKEKLLTWCSRTIAKGQPYANPIKNIAFRHYNLKNLNIYLHRNLYTYVQSSFNFRS